jgi:hypothetical protein
MSKSWPLLVFVSLKYCAEKNTHVAFFMKVTVYVYLFIMHLCMGIYMRECTFIGQVNCKAINPCRHFGMHDCLDRWMDAVCQMPTSTGAYMWTENSEFDCFRRTCIYSDWWMREDERKKLVTLSSELPSKINAPQR